MLFDQFKTDRVDMSKVEKKKGTSVNLAGLIFTNDESISGWANRTEQVI